MRKRPTLSMISEQTGLSTAAVSMILSGKQAHRFSQESVDRVWECAREIGYENRNAKRNIVLIVCPSVINPYYATLLQGIELKAQEAGFCTLICNTYWDLRREKAIVDIVADPRICGTIFAMAPQQPEIAAKIARKLPLVVVADKGTAPKLDTVEVSNFDAGKLMGRHLLSLGHTHIAYLSTSLNKQHSSRLLRLEGLRNVYEGKGVIELLTKDIDSSRELSTVEIEHTTGMQLAHELLEAHPEVTAVVAVNDMVGYGVMDGLAQEGKRIPQDYSVAGFDNIYPSQFHGVDLTTVDHYINLRGQCAFQLLKRKLDGASDLAVTHMEFQNKLIVRQTTAAPRPHL